MLIYHYKIVTRAIIEFNWVLTDGFNKLEIHFYAILSEIENDWNKIVTRKQFEGTSMTYLLLRRLFEPIKPLPVTRFTGKVSWGYDTGTLTIKPSYTRNKDFVSLVNENHEN